MLLREQFPPTIFVEYDAGDVHGYKGKSWHKLKPMSRHDSVVLVAMVQNGDHKVARKMYVTFSGHLDAKAVANKIKAKLAKKGELVPSPPFQYYIHTSAFLVCISI